MKYLACLERYEPRILHLLKYVYLIFIYHAFVCLHLSEIHDSNNKQDYSFTENYSHYPQIAIVLFGLGFIVTISQTIGNLSKNFKI